jgi:hypothetical protein
MYSTLSTKPVEQGNRASGNPARRTDGTRLSALQVWLSPGLQEASTINLHCFPDATGGSAQCFSRFRRARRYACQLRWATATVRSDKAWCTAIQYAASLRRRWRRILVSNSGSTARGSAADSRVCLRLRLAYLGRFVPTQSVVRRNADIVVHLFGHHF